MITKFAYCAVFLILLMGGYQTLYLIVQKEKTTQAEHQVLVLQKENEALNKRLLELRAEIKACNIHSAMREALIPK